MKKFIKNWFFSIFCYSMAIAFPIYTIIAMMLFDEELLFYTLVMFSCIAPSLMLVIFGIANQPKKDNKNE